MVKNVNPSRLSFRIEFGQYENTEQQNPNTGEPIKDFKPSFSVYAGIWSMDTDQSLSLAGKGIKDAVIFVVRHNAALNTEMLVRKGEVIYQIDTIASDDGLPPDGYDLVTCHKWVINHG